MSRTKNFICTIWNVDNTKEDYLRIMDEHKIRFMAYGLEECPETKKKHHQAFVLFNNKKVMNTKTLNKIGKMFGPIHSNVDFMRGTLAENENYCSKEGVYTELGDKPKPGRRSDLDDLKNKLVEGKTSVDQIILEDPMAYHQYGRTLEKIETVVLRKKRRNWMTEGIWLTGPSGCGKSHKAFTEYGDDYYVFSPKTKWWDGYTGQSVVIINEFRGCMLMFHELLEMVDKWPMNVPVRNKEDVPFLAKKVIITSVLRPRDCYSNLSSKDSWEQFNRRFVVLEKNVQGWSEGNNRTSDLNNVEIRLEEGSVVDYL